MWFKLLIILFYTNPTLLLGASAYQLYSLSQVDSTEEAITEAFSSVTSRSSPRETVKGYFDAMVNSDYLKALEYLDLSIIPESDRVSSSIILLKQFESLLDQSGNVDPINLISNQPEGDLEDGLGSDLEVVGFIYWKGESIPIYLELVRDLNQRPVWLFSTRTLERIPEDPGIADNLLINKFFPEGMNQTSWRGSPISHWVGICLLAIAAYLLAWLLTTIIDLLIRLLWENFKPTKHVTLLKTFLIPLRIVIVVVLLVSLSRALNISILVRQTFSIINLSLLWIALFTFIWLLIGTIATYGEHRLREKNNLAGLSVTLFLRNGAKFVLISLALIMILDTFGVNVTAGIAALGIGGIAIALGAQKTIENLVGSITVIFDQPVRVGDFCKVGETLGTVESIGMRSTRIRTIDRTIVTIPNGDFASRLIENYTHRDIFLYRKKIGLRYETTANQMRYILVELRKLLYAHPKVDSDPARVRFTDYGSDSLQVELFAYLHAKDYNEFLAIQEDLNLRLASVVEESGSGFAFPSQTIYLSKDQGLSQAKSQEAEKKVQQWIQNKELELPEFDEDSISQIRGTIKYPSEGSSQSNTENKPPFK